MTFEFNKLIKTTPKGKVMLRPGINIFFYMDRPLPEIAPFVAQALEAYLEFIPAGTLQTYFANNGTYRNYTTRQLNKDLKTLRKVPEGYEAFLFEYSQGVNGEVGSYAIHFYGTLLDLPKSPLETNLLRMEFPYDALDDVGIERFIDFVAQVADLVPFESGNAGFAMKRSQLYKNNVSPLVNQLLPRYLGFDPSFEYIRYETKGHTFSAHWINLFGDELTKRLGGPDAIRKALPEADIRQLDHSLLVRAAKLPPIGDVNRRAPDIGRLPDLARLMIPTRLKITGFGEPNFDPMPWLARYDNMDSRPWDNE